MVVAFVDSLLADQGLTPAAARHHLRNLRTVFVTNCGHTKIFNSDILTAARRSLSLQTLTPDFASTAPAPNGGEQLPFTVDMLAAMREEFWKTILLTTK
jgi:hypothetical protein